MTIPSIHGKPAVPFIGNLNRLKVDSDSEKYATTVGNQMPQEITAHLLALGILQVIPSEAVSTVTTGTRATLKAVIMFYALHTRKTGVGLHTLGEEETLH